MIDQTSITVEWKAALASAEKQLALFERGMKWLTQGVDRTDVQKKSLQKIIKRYKKLLG